MEDNEIIALFWNRDETAIRAASEKYYNYCYRIAWNIINNQEDSEECVNDTWFAAWTCMPPKRPVILSAFLGKITRGFAIDCFRKKNAGKRVDMHMADIAQEVGYLDKIAADTLERHMQEKEFLRLVNDFLRALPDADRDIFIRRYWYMDSLKEIAKRHCCSVSRIKSNLYRNRKRLWKLLEKERPEQIRGRRIQGGIADGKK